MTNLNFMKMMREKFDIEDAIDIMLVSGFRVSFCWSGSQLSAVQHFTRWGLVIELFVNILCTFDFSPTFLHCGTQTLNQDWHLTHSAPIWNVIVSAAHDVCLSKRAPRQQQGKNLSFPKKRRKMGLEKNFSLNRDCCLQTSIFANPNLSKPVTSLPNCKYAGKIFLFLAKEHTVNAQSHKLTYHTIISLMM